MTERQRQELETLREEMLVIMTRLPESTSMGKNLTKERYIRWLDRLDSILVEDAVQSYENCPSDEEMAARQFVNPFSDWDGLQ